MTQVIIRPRNPPHTRAPEVRRTGALAFACRRCGSRVPAGPAAVALQGSGPRIALDRACPACGHRALYRAEDRIA